jgi:3-oxoacyl-[acyl-carrier protein] reductase
MEHKPRSGHDDAGPGEGTWIEEDRVNSVNPGPVVTEGFKTSGLEGSEFEKQMLQSTPLGRLGTPDDIAEVVAFLASDDARWVSGSLIQVADGMR